MSKTSTIWRSACRQRRSQAALVRLMAETGIRPVVDSTLPLEDAAAGFRRLADGDVFGKIVLTRGT